MDIYEKIEEHKKNGSNILITTTEIEHSDFFTPVIDSVTLSMETDAYPRDSRDKDKMALSFQGLNKLGVCAGVQWHPHETRRTDNGNDRLYISFRAVGGVKKADGSMVWHAGNYDLDLEIVKEEIEEGHRKKARDYKKKAGKETEDYVEFCTTRDWRAKRRHKHALAESGAKARVLRSLLGVKNIYTMAELKKPFVVVRYVFRPPVNDPYVRQQLVNAAMSSMTGVYGPAPSLPHLPAENCIDIPIPMADDDYPEASGHEPEPEVPPEESAPPETPPAGKKKKEADPPLDPAMWTAATRGEKQVEVRRLAKITGYDLPGFENRAGVGLSKLEDTKLNGLFKNLSDLFAKQQEAN